MSNTLKPLYWVGSSKKDLMLLPELVRDVFGYALRLSQDHKKTYKWKKLKWVVAMFMLI